MKQREDRREKIRVKRHEQNQRVGILEDLNKSLNQTRLITSINVYPFINPIQYVFLLYEGREINMRKISPIRAPLSLWFTRLWTHTHTISHTHTNTHRARAYKIHMTNLTTHRPRAEGDMIYCRMMKMEDEGHWDIMLSIWLSLPLSPLSFIS